jgi:hypothetical protein
MNLVFYDDENKYYDSIEGVFIGKKLKYRESWEWLMPVVEKICHLRIGDGKEFTDYAYPRTFGMLNAETGQIMVRLNGSVLFEADTLIEATWLAVVDFITWHNKKEK